jgi:hypothetical protein
MLFDGNPGHFWYAIGVIIALSPFIFFGFIWPLLRRKK